MARLATLLGAAALVFAGQLFALNGDQWDWWRWACFAGAAIVVCCELVKPRAPRSVADPAGALGAALLVVGVAVMSLDYSDPYAGSFFWPHALALVALLGFTLLCVAMAAARARSPT